MWIASRRGRPEAAPPSGDWARLARTAVRQLEDADLYLAAVQALDLPDPGIEREVGRVRAELAALRHRLERPRLGVL
ncbi:MAG: hypothetical protein ACREPA_10015 [Candidatus Dormibacteraceae bacterium]